jgi:hypothetical protein
MKFLLSCITVFARLRASYISDCRTEHYPQAFDGLDGKPSNWHFVITDASDSDVIYLGGEMGGAGAEQPAIAKYDTAKLRFDWFEILQVPNGSASKVWNLADTTENDLLAALVETDDSEESLLYVLQKESGAPALPAFLFDYKGSGGSTKIGDIKPTKTSNLNWQNSSVLWVVTGYEAGAAWSAMTLFKSVALKLIIDESAQTCSVAKQFASEDGEVFTASTLYAINGAKTLVIGGAIKGSPELLTVYYFNTAAATTKRLTIDYSSYGSATSTDRQSIADFAFYYNDGVTDALFFKTIQVEKGLTGLGTKVFIARISGPGGVGTTVKFLNPNNNASVTATQFLGLKPVSADIVHSI